VVVFGGGKTGAYQISTNFAANGDDPCRFQASFTGSDRKGGTIGTQSCTFDISLGDRLFYDRYELKLTEASTVEVNATSSAFDPLLYLLDEAGDRIAAEIESGGRGNAVLRVWLRPGNYSVMLIATQAVGGAYTLQYTAQPGAAQPCNVQNLTIGQDANGTLGASSCRTAFGLSDVYKVTLPASGTLELAMQSQAFDTLLAIRDEKDDVIVANDDYTGVSDSYLPVDLPAGTYTISAVSNGGSGAYVLSSRVSAHDIPPCTRLEKMSVNTGVVRQLGFTPCRAANGQPEDYYEFTLPSAGTIAAVLSAPLVDIFVTLTDASGAVLRTDDNSYGSGDAILIEYLDAGTYRLAVRAAQTSSGGAYELDLLHRAGDRPAGCAPRATVEVGSTTSGNINFAGCQLPGDFADVYQFSMAAAGSVELKMESKDFDSYAILLDGRGNVVSEDDDSGGSGNARLTAVLQPGTYTVIARPISQYAYDSGGAYTLSLAALPDSEVASAAAPPVRTAKAAHIDDHRHNQNHQIDAFNRLPGVRQPRVSERGQRKHQKPQ
jgi:hypothetical protein